MVDLTDAKIDTALERGRIAQQTKPRATAARYDKKNGRIIVDLTNGCTFVFPPRMAQGLETATDEELASIEILGAGYGLHWETLDADLSVPAVQDRQHHPPRQPPPAPMVPRAASEEAGVKR